MARRNPAALDRELADWPEALRWREWMGRVEAAIFASPKPLPREDLAALVGANCILDDLIADIRDELAPRPYELVAVAGGWQLRSRSRFAEAIRATQSPDRPAPAAAGLSPLELLALAAIAHHQPITRDALAGWTGREISRDILAMLKQRDLITNGPRAPLPGAPATYVTTALFLEAFGLHSLRDLLDRSEETQDQQAAGTEA